MNNNRLSSEVPKDSIKYPRAAKEVRKEDNSNQVKVHTSRNKSQLVMRKEDASSSHYHFIN